jgi:ribosome-binding protein aMBF1 (putative translation factor)
VIGVDIRLPTIVGGRLRWGFLPSPGLKPVDLSQGFGKALRRRREAAEISQEELAHRAGLTRNYVSLLECGDRNPTLNAMAMLAQGLQITLLDLLSEVLDR